jgi:hypothetical protein
LVEGRAAKLLGLSRDVIARLTGRLSPAVALAQMEITQARYEASPKGRAHQIVRLAELLRLSRASLGR